MKNRKKFKELSNAYGVSASCLRYWDKIGLVNFNRNDENDWRETSYRSTIELGHVLEYRNLKVPIEKLQCLSGWGIDDIENVLDDSLNAQLTQLKEIQDTIKEIEKKKSRIEIVKELKAESFKLVKHHFPAIERYHFFDPLMIKRYFSDMSSSVVFVVPEVPTCGFVYGAYIDENSIEPELLRQEDKEEHLCLRGLLRLSPMDKSLTDNNVVDFIEKAKELGYSPG